MSDGAGPKYVVRGGEQVFAPPFIQRDTRMQAFVLRGDASALQATVDRCLNAPANGAVSYRVLSRHVLLAYAPIGSTQSTEPPDSELGYTPETDVAFWVLVGAGQERGGVWVLDRLAWFLPYVWVDVPTTMATGREVYGYPKEVGYLTLPSGADDPLIFAMETAVLSPYAPTTELTRRPILRVASTHAEKAPGRAWESVEDAFVDLEKIFEAERKAPIIPGLQFWKHLLGYILNREVPMVFLKQFRDVVDPTLACYQAILESPAKVQGTPRGGLLGGEHVVTVHSYDSHPIAADLGLGAPDAQGVLELAPELSFHVTFDFLVELGTLIWQAGRGPSP